MINSRFDSRISFFLIAATLFSFLISLALLQVFVGLLTILWLFEKWNNKRKAFDYISLLVILFGAMRLASVFLSPFPETAMQALYKDALFYLGFFSLNFYLKTFDEDKLKKIFLVFFAGGTAAALIGIVLFNLRLVHRAESFTSGYMTFSSYLVAISGAGFFILSLFTDKLKKWYWTAGVIIIITALILSLGRTNILIAGLVFIGAVILKKINWKEGLIIVVAAAVICWLSFMNNQQEVQQRIQNAGQFSDRDIITRTAFEMIGKTPLFGFGPRTFDQVFPNKNMLADKGIASWHNDILQMYFDGGIFGLITFLMLTFLPVWIGFKMYRKVTPGLAKIILLSMLISVGALLLSSLTSGFINSPVLSVVFGFQLAMISTLLNIAHDFNRGY